MTMQSVAFARFFISEAPLAARRDREMTAADFAGVAWQEVHNVETLGRLGSLAEFGEHQISSRGLDRVNLTRLRRRAAIFAVDFEVDREDPGQGVLWAASAAEPADFAFRVVFPAGTGERVFCGQVGDLFETFGAADAQPRLSASIVVNSNTVRL